MAHCLPVELVPALSPMMDIQLQVSHQLDVVIAMGPGPIHMEALVLQLLGRGDHPVQQPNQGQL